MRSGGASAAPPHPRSGPPGPTRATRANRAHPGPPGPTLRETRRRLPPLLRARAVGIYFYHTAVYFYIANI